MKACINDENHAMGIALLAHAKTEAIERFDLDQSTGHRCQSTARRHGEGLALGIGRWGDNG